MEKPKPVPPQSTNSSRTEDRRRFLRNSTAALSAAAIAAPAVHAQTGAGSDAQLVKLGIVGCGGRGTGALNNTLSINENIKIVAGADLFSEKVASMRTSLSRKHEDAIVIADDKMHEGLDGYKKVLDDPEVDLVLLTTSPGFRPYHILEAVKAGKHVFAEKPTCVDPAGYRICLEAHELAEKNGTAIVTGTQYRRQVNYIGAVEQIRKGTIGDIVGATSRYCSTGIWYRNRKENVSDTQYQLDNWMHFIWLSGDQIAEQAVHNIDTMNWVMGGPPESVYGAGGRFTRPDDSEMWDNIGIDYVYPGDRSVSFMCRQIPSTKGDNSNAIHGTEGTCFIGAGSKGSHIVDRDGKEVWRMEGSIADAYEQEHKDLIDSIREGKPIVELKQTADSSLTAVMGRMAAYTGQVVTWDFVTKESKLDLFPKDLDWNGSRPESEFAIPGKTKLV